MPELDTRKTDTHAYWWDLIQSIESAQEARRAGYALAGNCPH